MIRADDQFCFPKLKPGVYNVALGNGTMFAIGIGHDPEAGLLVAVIGKGAYTFTVPPHYSYVAQKLNLGSYEGDAKNLADFIADQLTTAPGDRPRVGTYASDLVAV